MTKKKTIMTIAIIASAVLVVIGYTFILRYYRYAKYGPHPIKYYTGIDTPAALKDGCTIQTAKHLENSHYHNGDLCLFGAIKEIDGSEYPEPTFLDLRIIDVYGDECTIVFRSTEGGEIYYTSNYPLENLIYDTEAVIAAQDYKHTILGDIDYVLNNMY